MADEDSNSVDVISTRTGRVTGSIAVQGLPMSIAASPDGSQVWVGNGYTGSISVISTATNTVSDTISGGGQATALNSAITDIAFGPLPRGYGSGWGAPATASRPGLSGATWGDRLTAKEDKGTLTSMNHPQEITPEYAERLVTLCTMISDVDREGMAFLVGHMASKNIDLAIEAYGALMTTALPSENS